MRSLAGERVSFQEVAVARFLAVEPLLAAAEPRDSMTTVFIRTFVVRETWWFVTMFAAVRVLLVAHPMVFVGVHLASWCVVRIAAPAAIFAVEASVVRREVISAVATCAARQVVISAAAISAAPLMRHVSTIRPAARHQVMFAEELAAHHSMRAAATSAAS